MKSLEIINKIESKKVELGMNVELGLVDDLAKLLVRMKAIDGALSKSTQKAVNSLNSFAKVQSDLNDSYSQATLDKEDAQSEIKIALSLISKVSAQAKDLGLNPNDIKGTKEVVDFTANLEDTIAILMRNEADMKKIISI